MENAKLVAGKLSEVQYNFLADEFGIDEQTFQTLSDDALDDLYDEIGFIEAEETMNADKENRDLTERGKIAVGIVTLIGDELYSPDGKEDDLSKD